MNIRAGVRNYRYSKIMKGPGLKEQRRKHIQIRL